MQKKIVRLTFLSLLWPKNPQKCNENRSEYSECTASHIWLMTKLCNANHRKCKILYFSHDPFALTSTVRSSMSPFEYASLYHEEWIKCQVHTHIQKYQFPKPQRRWCHGFYRTALPTPEHPWCFKTTAAKLIFIGVGTSNLIALWKLWEDPGLGHQWRRFRQELGIFELSTHVYWVQTLPLYLHLSICYKIWVHLLDM